MSNANNPQLEKLKAEYQELILDDELPNYLRQEVALLFFLLGKEKNTFLWDKDDNYFQLRAMGDEVIELYSLVKLLGMGVQTAGGDTEAIFTLYSSKSATHLHNKVCDLLTEMINTAFPEDPVQHPKVLAHHD